VRDTLGYLDSILVPSAQSGSRHRSDESLCCDGAAAAASVVGGLVGCVA
jgi:hypothetical protein